MADQIAHRLICRVSWPETTKLAINQGFWSMALNALVKRIDFSHVKSFGLRLATAPAARLETTIAIGTAAGGVSGLEQLAKSLGTYDGIDGVSVSFATAGRPDGAYRSLADGRRIQPHHSALACADDGAIYMRIALDAQLLELIGLARRAGMACAYEFVARPYAPSTESVRALLHNCVALEDVPGMPAGLLADQQDLAARYKAASILTDSCIVLNAAYKTPNAVMGRLTQMAEETVYAQFGERPALSQIGSARADQFTELLAIDYDLPPGESRRPFEETAGKVASPEDVVEVVKQAWIATSLADQVDHDVQMQIQHRASAQTALPEAATEPYLFVSYARADERTTFAFIAALEARGVRCWIDRQIAAGTEWDAQLESRIRTCAGMVAIITPDYLASVNCVREIKFADQLKKPIVPVVANGVQLNQGLDFLLAARQQYRLDDIGAPDRIAAMMAATQ